MKYQKLSRIRVTQLLSFSAIVMAALACGCSDTPDGETGWHIGEQPDASSGADALVDENAYVVSIEAGERTCLLYSDGAIRCAGQLATRHAWEGEADDPHGALVEIPGVSDALSFSATHVHGCALLPQGKAWCWGSNGAHQMTDVVPTDEEYPTEIPQLDDVVQVATGFSHSCALHAGGEVSCWGDNRTGQIGIGVRGVAEDGNGTVPRPETVVDLPEATAIELGDSATCAITTDRLVYCWGDEYFKIPYPPYEQFDGRAQPTPKLVEGLSDVRQLSFHLGHVCALDGAGDIWCWGRNYWGQLGDDLDDERWTPTRVEGLPEMVDVTTGVTFSCALAQDGQVWCWGGNSYGQLGRGIEDEERDWNPRPRPVRRLENAVDVEAGGTYVCARLEDHSVKCWGLSIRGRFGQIQNSSRIEALPVETAW